MHKLYGVKEMCYNSFYIVYYLVSVTDCNDKKKSQVDISKSKLNNRLEYYFVLLKISMA